MLAKTNFVVCTELCLASPPGRASPQKFHFINPLTKKRAAPGCVKQLKASGAARILFWGGQINNLLLI